MNITGETWLQESLTLFAGSPTIIFDDTHTGHDKYKIIVDDDKLQFGAGSPISTILTLDSLNGQFVGIGTTSPYAKLSVVGETVSAFFTATTTDTNTFSGDIVNRTKNLTNYADFYNGTFDLTFDALVQSDGSTALTTIDAVNGSTLIMRFSDGDIATTTPLAIALTAGSDSSPQANYIYIPQSTKVLTKSTTAYPSSDTEFIKIGYFLCPSVATIQTNDGCYVNQNINDGNGNGGGSEKGHITDITSRLRLEGAKYFSGIDENGDGGTYLVITAGNVEFKSTSGVIAQLHLHDFPAFDTSGGDEVLVKNWNGDAYHNITNLNDITADSQGVSTSGKWVNLVIWGVANKNADNYEPVMINLPSCSYNTQSNAEQDINGCDDYSMP